MSSDDIENIFKQDCSESLEKLLHSENVDYGKLYFLILKHLGPNITEFLYRNHRVILFSVVISIRQLYRLFNIKTDGYNVPNELEQFINFHLYDIDGGVMLNDITNFQDANTFKAFRAYFTQQEALERFHTDMMELGKEMFEKLNTTLMELHNNS